MSTTRSVKDRTDGRAARTAGPAASSLASGSSDVRQHAVERPGDAGEIKRAHQQTRVLALAAGSGTHKPAQLPLGAPSLLGWLPLEDAEGPGIAVSLDDFLDRGGAQRADQLVLQIGGTHVETECLHPGARQT